MTKQLLVIDGNSYAVTTADLGDLIASGELKQVGVIRTEYVIPAPTGDGHIVRGRSLEAVLQDDAGAFLAVERHRGLAICTYVGDEEMNVAFRNALATDNLEEGEAFIYDQRIVEGTELLENVGLDMSDVTDVNHGDDGVAA